ncbi:MAG: hypothetical protein E7381_02530 [Clostridiales bacterium]|nr:hypothetical protein [Clostridiales bacterium]
MRNLRLLVGRLCFCEGSALNLPQGDYPLDPLTWVSARRQGWRGTLTRWFGATYGCLLEGFVPSYDGDCHRGAKTLSLQSARE